MPDGNETPEQVLTQAPRYHAACVAMATADFCGAGQSNTVDDTPITLFNDTNVRLEPGSGGNSWDPLQVAGGPFGPYEARFEAAWTSQPEYVHPDVKAWRSRAVCLTKKRWSTLNLGGMCPAQLPDPRRAGQSCDSMSAQEVFNQGAVLFSYSSFIDAGLYRFKHRTVPGRFVTTAAVDFLNDGDPRVYEPVGVEDAHDYVLDMAAPNTAFEGTVLSVKAPKQLPALKDALRLVRRENGVGGYFLHVLAQGEPEEARDVPEGHVLAQVPGQARELSTWSPVQSPDAMVTTTKNMSSQGYVKRSLEAWLPLTLKAYLQGP